MTWPVHATRAEILRILEINAHIYTEWVITRAETEAILAITVTDEQMTDLVDLVARQATILRDFGSRLDYTEAEVCTMVNNAQPHEGVRHPEPRTDAEAAEQDVAALRARIAALEAETTGDAYVGLVQWRSEAERLTKNLATLRAGIEYAHQLHTPEGMPDEPANCAHPACAALATLAPGPTEGRDG